MIPDPPRRASRRRAGQGFRTSRTRKIRKPDDEHPRRRGEKQQRDQSGRRSRPRRRSPGPSRRAASPRGRRPRLRRARRMPRRRRRAQRPASRSSPQANARPGREPQVPGAIGPKPDPKPVARSIARRSAVEAGAAGLGGTEDPSHEVVPRGLRQEHAGERSGVRVAVVQQDLPVDVRRLRRRAADEQVARFRDAPLRRAPRRSSRGALRSVSNAIRC